MTRVIAAGLGFLTGFVTALTGAWWMMETIVKVLVNPRKVRQ